MKSHQMVSALGWMVLVALSSSPVQCGIAIRPSERAALSDDTIIAEDWSNADTEGDSWSKRTKRSTATNGKIWPNGVIPYEFDPNVAPVYQHRIKMAMSLWEQGTCLKFRPAFGSDRNRIRFRFGSGCISSIGMTGIAVQTITLDNLCLEQSRKTIHEIGHALGLYHEHIRPDRDQYVRVNLQNGNFNALTWDKVMPTNLPYDYLSIMHYSGTDFAPPGMLAIETLDPAYQNIIGTVEKISSVDYQTINQLYKCPSGK